MPLSQAAPRNHLHNRNIELKGYVREDGLFDIEGRIEDTKTYAFHNEWRGEMRPGMPVHNMSIRLTVNTGFEVVAVEAVTDNSPFPICPDITGNFQRLVGVKIAPGWNRQVKQRLGGVQGCTHLVELLGPVATVAMQTIRPYLRHQMQGRLKDGEPDPTTTRPAQLNSCHAWASDSPVIKRWMPQFYTGSDSPAEEMEQTEKAKER